jgi:lysophospholipase L1-like esterase
MLSLRFSLRRRSAFPWRSLVVVFGTLIITGCGGPTSPQTLGPVLVCPSPLRVTSLDGNATPVAYEAPQIVAGEAPFRSSCAPPSGSNFLIGVSTVVCTVTDSVARTDSCSFTVTVTAPTTITATRFMAFGNSITEGKIADHTIITNNYPEVLRGLLAARYTSQPITVENKGLGGEYTSQGAIRLTAELDNVRPQILLLEEGINDLSSGSQSSIGPMIENLRSMVREAQRRDVGVFLATLTPVRAGSSGGGAAFPLLTEANDRIRNLALSERATLVDLYLAFGGIAGTLIDTDGLHPNAQGYQRIAETFFDRIRATLEGPLPIGPVFVRHMPVPNMPGMEFR